MVEAAGRVEEGGQVQHEARLDAGVVAPQPGAGGAAQIVMEMVKQRADLDILHIAYKGSGPALNDLYGAQVASFFAPYTPLMGQITGGKLKLQIALDDGTVQTFEAEVPE